MFRVENKEELINTIDIIDNAFQILNSIYYNDKKHEMMNYNKVQLSSAALSSKFIVEASQYNKFLKKHQTDDCMIPIIGKKIHTRVKALESLHDKIEQYLKNTRIRGNVIINKSINDMFGCRFLVEGLNENLEAYRDLLIFLKDNGYESIYRPYIKNKETSKYCAIHFYLKDSNKHFCWEVQLWDPNSFEDNFKEHKKHEDNRIKY